MDRRHNYVGKTLGNYRITAELATGVSSDLLLAKKISSEEELVAIKLLHSASLVTQQDEARFLQEAWFLQELHHPSILPILDLGIDQTIPYIVTDYAPQGSLHTRMHAPTTTPLARDEALAIISQIGQALLYLHRYDLIHGNLKPHNILFDSRGNAVLTDMQYPSLQKTPNRLSTRPLSLSPYTAPEQLAGSLHKESDQYAFGCIIYEIFTGKAPFSMPSSADPDGTATPRPRTTLARLKARLPQDIALIILKAIAREPSQRYSDIHAFLHALGVLTTTDSSQQKALSLPPEPTSRITNHHTPIILRVGEILETVTPSGTTQQFAAHPDSDDQFKGAAPIKTSPSVQNENFPLSSVIASSLPMLEEPIPGTITLPTPGATSLNLSKKNKLTTASKGAISHQVWNKLLKNASPRPLKEWPLMIAALVIMIVSILGTLAFGSLSLHSSQGITNSSTTAQALKLAQGKGTTPTVIASATPTNTPVPPLTGQRVVPMPTPTPTPTPAPTPTNTSPITSNGWELSPGGFSPANCVAINNQFECAAQLSLSPNATRILIWYTSSENIKASFSPRSGFLFPGQSVQVTITIAANCPSNGRLNFITSHSMLVAPWNCDAQS